MKFSTFFLSSQSELPDAFKQHFLKYIDLKHSIKMELKPVSLQCHLPNNHVDGQSNTFVGQLIADCLLSMAPRVKEFFFRLDEQVQRVSLFYANEEDRVCTFADVLEQAPDQHVIDKLVSSIVQLQQFGLLNLTALTKILKKHDKYMAMGTLFSEMYMAQVTKTHRFVRHSTRLASAKARLVELELVPSLDILTPKPSSWLNLLRPARGIAGSNFIQEQTMNDINDSMAADSSNNFCKGRSLSTSIPLMQEGKAPSTWFPPMAILPGQRLLITLSGPHGTDITAALLGVLSTHGVKLEDFSFSRLHHQVTFVVHVYLPNQPHQSTHRHIDHTFVSDLAQAAKKWHATLLFDAPDPDTPLPPSLEDAPYNNRTKYSATVLNMTGLSVQFLHAFTSLLLQYHISVERMGRLNSSLFLASEKSNEPMVNPVTCIDYQLSIPHDADTDTFRSELFALGTPYNTDVALQEATVFRRSKRLVVFDMDSTLIEQEVIDEIARDAGVVDQVAKITESAMRGELDFSQSLLQRVALLKDTPVSVLDSVRQRITFVPGARDLCRCLKRLGFKLAVISGGFLPLAQYVKSELGLDYAFANQLKVDASTSKLTGQTIGQIVDGVRKKELLEVIAQAEGILAEQVIAIGDGANDLYMLAAAGLGVAFNAKPKVQQKAHTRINQKSLRSVMYLLGYSDSDIQALLML